MIAVAGNLQDSGRLGDVFRTMGEIGGRHQLRRSLLRREPVAELPFAADDEILRAGKLVMQSAFHRLIIFRQHRRRTVVAVKGAGEQGHGIPPPRRAVVDVQHRRSDRGGGAFRREAVPDIAEIFPEKSQTVHIQHRRGSENLRVTGPAEPLVTLRAVGRNLQKVAALSPESIEPQPVDAGVAA